VAPSRRSLLRESRFALIAPLAALAAYLPAIVVPYAFMDDYYVLAWREGLEGEFFKTATSFGRPLHAVFLGGTFALASDIDSLRLVRLVSLIGVMALAVLLYEALRRAELDRWFATGVCITVVSLASFQVYVSWAAIGEAPFVAILAGLAALRLQSSFGLQGRAALIRWAQATVLLLAALLTYQPAAMFFWVFVVIDVLRPGRRLGEASRRLAAGLAVAAAALFVSYAALRVGVHFYGGAFAGRTNLVHDLVSKARWFWNEPIVNSFGLFGLLPAASVALAGVIVAVAGIASLHAERGREALGFVGLAALLVPLSYLPNLAIAEEFASYRSIGALASLLTVYLWLGLWGIRRALTSPSVRGAARTLAVLSVAALLSFLLAALVIVPFWRPAERVSLGTFAGWPELATLVAVLVVLAAAGLWRAKALGAATLAVFALGGIVIAARNVTTLFVKTQSTELQLLRSQLERPAEPGRVVFVKPSITDPAAPLVRYDEFGPPSTYFPWVPSPAVRLVLRERSPALRPEIEILAWDQAPAKRPPADEAFVDMRRLRQRRVGWGLWTLRATTVTMSNRLTGRL
jgi:hypothetical protein